MHDIFNRLWQDFIGRISGPMHLRLVIQPLVAGFLALLSGLKDAHEGRPPFLWTVITDPAQRPDLLRRSRKDVGKVFIIAIVLDSIYQLVVQRGVYVLEVLVVATTLAVVPYILIRGPVTRIRKMLGSRTESRRS